MRVTNLKLLIPASLTVAAIAAISYLSTAGKIAKSQELQANSTIVQFTSNSFTPQTVSVRKNQSVTFVNKSDDDMWPASNIHPTHGIYPEFDPQKPTPPGKSWTFVFGRVGEWRYHDHLHPEVTGTVTVE